MRTSTEINEGLLDSLLVQKELKANKKKEGRCRWGFLAFLGCCPDNSPPQGLRTVVRSNKDTTTTTATLNHYHISATSSLFEEPKIASILIAQDNNPNNSISVFYPMDRLFLLGIGVEKIISIIQRVTLQGLDNKDLEQTHFSMIRRNLGSIDHDVSSIISRNCSVESSFHRNEIFSQYQKGIKVDPAVWNEVTVEPVAKHIAKQFQNMFVVDALCGCGANTVQFGWYCSYVIGIDIDSYRVNFAMNNARVYEVGHKIDFLNANFFTMNKIRADAVFLAPNELKCENNERFSIFKHLDPDIVRLVEHSLRISPNICLQLPWQTPLEELGVLFARIYNSNPALYTKYQFSMRLEQIFLDNTQYCLVVYFGPCSQIKHHEEHSLLNELLNGRETSPTKKKTDSSAFIQKLINYVGLQQSINAFAFVEESENKTEYLFESLVRHLIQRKIVTEEILELLLKQDETSSSVGICGTLAPIYENTHAKNLISRREIADLKTRQTQSADSPIEVPSNNRSVIKGCCYQEDELYNSSCVDMSRTRSDSPPTSRPNIRHLSVLTRFQAQNSLSQKNSALANSGELSELAVSSYSLRSGALIDSCSDTERPTSKHFRAIENTRVHNNRLNLQKYYDSGSTKDSIPLRNQFSVLSSALPSALTSAHSQAKSGLAKKQFLSPSKAEDSPESSPFIRKNSTRTNPIAATHMRRSLFREALGTVQ